jgi:hypothetical protein
MREYSFYISSKGNDKYTISYKSWEKDEEGNQINVKTKMDFGLTLEKAVEEQTKFIENNG